MDTNKRQSLIEIVEEQFKGKVSDDVFNTQMELATAIESTIRMFGIMVDDTRTVLDFLGKDPGSQFWRRTFVRTMFANIEAQLSIMKQTAVMWHRLGAIKLADKDLRKLAGEIRLIWDASQIPGEPIRLTLSENFRFAFKVYCLIPPIPTITVDTNSQGWQSLLVAIKVRDNLTHPKTEQNLLIDDAHGKRIFEAWLWFVELSTEMFQVGGQAAKQLRQSLDNTEQSRNED